MVDLTVGLYANFHVNFDINIDYFMNDVIILSTLPNFVVGDERTNENIQALKALVVMIYSFNRRTGKTIAWVLDGRDTARRIYKFCLDNSVLRWYNKL